jgi:hypothetical protein
MYNKPQSNTQSAEVKISQMLDIIFLMGTLILIVSTFFVLSDEGKIKIMKDTYTFFADYIEDPYSILYTFIIAVILYTTVYIFQIPMTYDTRPAFIYYIEIHIWVLMLLIIIYDFFKYVLGISLDDFIDKMDIFNRLPDHAPTDSNTVTQSPTVLNNITKSPTVLNNITKSPTNPEVFNISNNKYTYNDAQAVCSTYGAKIATYDQIEQAYNKGGEWCNYGWSDGQMIFFPTQKSTWDNLQKDPKHKNDCGRPGINGGYMANPNLKFGVNCYGIKPQPTAAELAQMKQSSLYSAAPRSEEESKLNDKINYWKQNRDSMNINSFNKSVWSATS